ncbi:MAG: FecR domain-containing protein [Vulcanimicrobiota bacterium]
MKKGSFKKIAILFLIVFASILFNFTSLFAQELDPNLTYAADIISVKGTGFKVKRITSDSWYPGHVNMPNYVKDVIETDDDTLACLEFMNGSQLGINKGTRVEIISTSQARDITRRGIIEKVVLKSGAIWAKVTGQKSKDFRVETGKGVLGVKGTEFVVEVDPEQDTEKITVLEGEVEFSDEAGETEDLTPGEILSFIKDDQPQVKKEDVSKIRKALSFQFPDLNPTEQALLSIFTSQAISNLPGEVSKSLSIARESLRMIENPEEFAANKALAEVSKNTNIPFMGSIKMGGNKKPKKVEVKNLSPDNDTVDTYFPEFSWDNVDGADAYRVLITRFPITKDEEKDDTGYYAYAGVKENKFSYTQNARALKPGFTYYWYVIPLNKGNKPMAKGDGKFTMADYPTLGIKGLYPAGNIKTMSDTTVFDWTPVNGVTRYKIKISKNEDMSEPMISEEVNKNYFEMANCPSYFFKNKDYFWKVSVLEKEPGTPEMEGIVNKFQITE